VLPEALSSIAQQFFKGVLGPGFTGQTFGDGHKLPSGYFKILAVIGRGLVRDLIGPSIAALVGHGLVITHAVQADLQVGLAGYTGLAAPR